jgi:hypothetical protein
MQFFGNLAVEASTSHEISCLMAGADHAASLGGVYQDIFGQFGPGARSNPEAMEAIYQVDNQRVDLINQLQGTAQAGIPYQKITDAEGNAQHIFNLIPQMAKRWEDPEFVKQTVESICASTFGPQGDWCVQAFFKRQESIKRFYAANDSVVEQLRDDLLRNPGKSVAQRSSMPLTVDGETRSLAEWGFSPYLDLTYFLTSFGGSGAVYQNGRPVGFMVPIQQGNETQTFFAPITQVGGKPVLLWPYFFAFGHGSATEWNAQFKHLCGEAC